MFAWTEDLKLFVTSGAMQAIIYGDFINWLCR